MAWFLAGFASGCGASRARPATDDEVADVALAVRRQLPGVRACYEQALAGDPTLSGTITVSFTLDALGNISGLRLTGFGRSRYFRQCVYWVFARAPFPPTRGEPATYSFPFHFSPETARDASAESLGVPH